MRPRPAGAQARPGAVAQHADPPFGRAEMATFRGKTRREIGPHPADSMLAEEPGTHRGQVGDRAAANLGGRGESAGMDAVEARASV